MIRADLAARVARELSLPRTTADRTVAAVFSTIAETLGRGESVTIAGFSTFTTRSSARFARHAIRAPGNASPSPRRSGAGRA